MRHYGLEIFEGFFSEGGFQGCHKMARLRWLEKNFVKEWA